MTFVDIDNRAVLHGPVLAPLTDEEFFDLCEHNPLLRLNRNANHEISCMPAAGFESSRKPGEVYGQLWLWNRQHHCSANDVEASFARPYENVTIYRRGQEPEEISRFVATLSAKLALSGFELDLWPLWRG